MARRTSLLRCLVAYPLLCLSGVLLAQEIPGGVPPGATLDDATFDPADLNPVLWYDPSTFLTDGSTKDGSNNVTKLANKGTGGSTYDMTVVTGTPLWVDGGLNGEDALDFETGDSDGLAVNATPITAAPMFVYAVVRFESFPASVTKVFSIGDKDTTADLWGLDHASGAGTAQWRAVDSTAAVAAHAGTMSAGTTYLLTGKEVSNVSRFILVDNAGAVENTTDRTPDAADKIGVGFNVGSAGGQFLDALVGDILVFTSALSAGDESDLVAYLDGKWAIPGVTSTPPLGPSDPYRWPLLLAAAGLGLLLASLRRRPQQREGRLLRLQPEAARRAA